MRWPCIRGSCLNTSYEAVEKNIWVSATKDRNTLFVLKDSQMISFTLSYENSPQTRMILARSQSKFVLVCIVCVGPSAGVQVVPLPETQAQWSSSKQIKKRALFHSSGNWYRTAISVLRTVKPTSLIAGKKRNDWNGTGWATDNQIALSTTSQRPVTTASWTKLWHSTEMCSELHFLVHHRNMEIDNSNMETTWIDLYIEIRKLLMRSKT